MILFLLKKTEFVNRSKEQNMIITTSISKKNLRKYNDGDGNRRRMEQSWVLGYTSSLADAGISPLSYAAQSVLTGAVNSAIPSVSIPVGDYTLNMSIGLGVTPGGIVGGSNLSITYRDGDFALTGGVGIGTNHWGWNTNVSV